MPNCCGRRAFTRSRPSGSSATVESLWRSRTDPHGVRDCGSMGTTPGPGRGRLSEGEAHQDLVAVVTGGHSQCPRPSADLDPAQLAVEVLEPQSGPRGEQ